MEEIEWLGATARYLSNYYGQPYTDAVDHLTIIMEDMRSRDESGQASFRDHTLLKVVSEDFSVEWTLLRKISSLEEFEDNSQSLAYRYTDEVDGLYTVLDHPDPMW